MRGEAGAVPDKRRPAPMAVVIAFGLIACVLYGFGAGLRSDIGILLSPLAEQCGLRYEDVSLCIAVMQIVFGAMQPFFGILASKRSNRFVLELGVLVTALGLVGMVASRSFAALMLSLGVCFGTGVGAVSFGLVLTSAIRFVGPKRAMAISGMLNAAAGLVGFALSPLLQALLDAGGTRTALLSMVVLAAALAPVVLVVTSHDPKPEHVGRGDGSGEQLAEKPARQASAGEGAGPAPTDGPAEESSGSVAALFREAFSNRTYLLLIAGFTTCGFHMVIIESHLFNQLVLFGIDATSASWAYSVYGVATVLGALLSGWLSSKVHMGRLLGFYYGFRALWVTAFLLLIPKTLAFSVLFAVGLGMTGDATVSPTAGLVNANFRIGQVATLIGVLFMCHQVGAFLSAWLGGLIVDSMGSYDLVWVLDIAVCAFACIMSLRIRDSATPAGR